MKRAAFILVAMVLVSAGCGDTADTTTTSPPSDQAATTTTPPPAVETTTTVPEETTTLPEETTTTTTMPEGPPVDVVAVAPIPVIEFDFVGQTVASPSTSLTIVKNEFVGILETTDPFSPDDCIAIGAADGEFTQNSDFYNASFGRCDPTTLGNFLPTDPLFMDDGTLIFDMGDPPHDPFSIFYTINRNDPDGLTDFERSRFGNPSAPINLSDIPDVSDRDWLGLPLSGRLFKPRVWELYENVLSPTGGDCVVDDLTSCLHNDRFHVNVNLNDGSTSGPANATTPDPATGFFFFLDPNNPDFLIKILNGCADNGHFWVFSAAVTDVSYALTVTDTVTGESRSYQSLTDEPAQAVTDTQAFATCP